MSMQNDSTPKRLLIVEDEPELREILVEVCKEITPHIETASNGKEALEIITSMPICAILSDINMPQMTGLQLLYHIREKGMETPFILLSGFGDRANVSAALKYGATEFIEKPYEEDKLKNFINLALDLGVALAEVERCSEDPTLSSDKILKLKKARQEIWKMKTLNETYIPKKKIS